MTSPFPHIIEVIRLSHDDGRMWLGVKVDGAMSVTIPCSTQKEFERMAKDLTRAMESIGGKVSGPLS